jgi:aryl-alcohol dehydrogenase-like predicted oxidoreductase
MAPAGTRVADLKPALLESAPWDALDSLAAFAQERDLTMVEVAFGWLLAQPGVASVIAGATTPAQVTANAAASGRWVPDAADLQAIDAIFPPPVGLGYR